MSQKHRKFVNKHTHDKPYINLPGVGGALRRRLAAAGFDKAYVLLGQFLLFKKNKELFQLWMKDICQANAKQSLDCWQRLKDWCEKFLL